jgi:hypothetical protein
MRLTNNIAGAPTFNQTILGSSSISSSTTTLKVAPSSITSFVLSPTFSAIGKLSHLEEDWDGCGSSKPSPTAIQRAITLVERFYKSIAFAAGIPHQWVVPHISASEEGEVVMEWWSNNHKLTVYVGEAVPQYLKVWGPNIATQMADGEIEGSQFLGLWLWLNA